MQDYQSRKLNEYIQDSRIELAFLTPYVSHINLIDGYSKFFKKIVLYNHYYETFTELKTTCEDFFRNPRRYQKQFRSLLMEKSPIMGAATS